MKTISVRLKENDERRIQEIKKWYKENLPFARESTTTDVIKDAIRELYCLTVKSNK